MKVRLVSADYRNLSMTHRRLRFFAVLAVIGQFASAVPFATACTGIRVRPKDGSVVCARTLEFAANLRSSVVIIPRGQSFVGTAPGDKPGMRWVSKYGCAGANALDLPLIVDGLNEKGLGVGIFYFPAYAKFEDVSESDRPKAIASHELATFLLGTCSDVAEAIEAVKSIKVGEVVVKELGGIPPVHYILNDRSGRCVVLEFVDGRLKVHDNPLGVVTNSPTFDWHVTNLRNYINLTVTNVPPVEISGEKLASFGHGSGMHGLPGDFTPPSRFVRAVAFSHSALPVGTAREGVLQAFHILNQFDIPKGAVRSEEGGREVVDHTLWTSASDLTNLRYHFHTYDSRRIKMVDLKKVDLDAKTIKTIPMSTDEVIEDLSGASK